MKIKVLFLIKHMDTGGGEFVFYSLITGLDKERFETVLVCLQQKGFYGEKLAREGYTVYDQVLRRQSDVAVVPRLRKIIRDHQIHVVYLMDYRDAMLWGPLAARWAGVPSILATHCTSWWNVRSLTMLGALLLPWHAAIVTLANFQKDHFVNNLRLPASKVTVIPNGIDYQKFSEPDGPPEPPVVLPPNHFIIGTVAALRPGKNVEMLLHAVQRLQAKGRPIHVLIVGDGTERTGLEALARTLQIETRVQFLGTRTDVHRLLPLLDVFVLSSDFEVMPLSVLEAMAAGRPVISTAVGSVPQIIQEGRTGYTVPVGDHAALSDTLGKLIDQPGIGRELGHLASAQARKEYTLQTMIDRNVRLIEETVKGL